MPGSFQGTGFLDLAWPGAAAVYQADVFANRPPAGPWNRGFRFFATDQTLEFRSDGTQWVLMTNYVPQVIEIPAGVTLEIPAGVYLEIG